MARIFNAGFSAITRNLLSSRSVLPTVQPCATLKAKVLEKLGIPPKPKRPLTPYFKFLRAERDKVLAEDPSLTANGVVKKLAEKWTTHSDKEKESLQKIYDLEILAYSKQIMTYEQSITPEHRRIMREAKEKQIDKAEKLKFKKKTEELGKPRKPPTAFIQFMQESKFSQSGHKKATDWLKSIAEKWGEMTQDEKSRYQQESQKLMDQYKRDIKDWEEKMVRLGHIDVVRNRGLIAMKINTAAKPE